MKPCSLHRSNHRRVARFAARCLVLGGLVASGALAAAGPVAAQAVPGDRENAQKRLETNRKLLKESKGRIGAIQSEMVQLRRQRAELNRDLIDTAARIKGTETQMTAIEQRLTGLEEEEKRQRTALRAQHKSISRLLSAMQRMGRNPPPVMITRRSDALTMVRSAMLLARAFPQLRTEATALTTRLNQLVATMNDIRKKREVLRAKDRELRADQTRMTYLLESKRQSTNIQQLELTEVENTVAIVSKNVTDLEALIDQLDKAIEKQTKIGQEIAEAEALRGTKQPENVSGLGQAGANETGSNETGPKVALNVPRPPAGPDRTAPGAVQTMRPTLPGSTRPTVSLTPEGGSFIDDKARIKPARPFHKTKGSLSLPAAGAIKMRFGEPTRYGGRSKGLHIKTRYGAQVTSPCDGWIVYAGNFRSYGQVLIIKAGGGYHVLLAGLSRIDVRSGQFVLASEPVGAMKSGSGRASGKELPTLYVEFRKNGRPINPRPWWAASTTEKVQG